jgi:lipopolysaccharide biosynthesis regulator YciM
MAQDDFEGAQALLTKGIQIDPKEPRLRIAQGLLYAGTGRREEAEKELKVIATLRGEAVVIVAKLLINAALGKNDEAFEALSRAAELHSWPFLIQSLPVFVELRKDPRYEEFAAKVGLSRR